MSTWKPAAYKGEREGSYMAAVRMLTAGTALQARAPQPDPRAYSDGYIWLTPACAPRLSVQLLDGWEVMVRETGPITKDDWESTYQLAMADAGSDLWLQSLEDRPFPAAITTEQLDRVLKLLKDPSHLPAVNEAVGIIQKALALK